jgi:hypothetical protein
MKPPGLTEETEDKFNSCAGLNLVYSMLDEAKVDAYFVPI